MNLIIDFILDPLVELSRTRRLVMNVRIGHVQGALHGHVTADSLVLCHRHLQLIVENKRLRGISVLYKMTLHTFCHRLSTSFMRSAAGTSLSSTNVIGIGALIFRRILCPSKSRSTKRCACSHDEPAVDAGNVRGDVVPSCGVSSYSCDFFK